MQYVSKCMALIWSVASLVGSAFRTLPALGFEGLSAWSVSTHNIIPFHLLYGLDKLCGPCSTYQSVYQRWHVGMYLTTSLLGIQS
jgi:hypothetical protein